MNTESVAKVLVVDGSGEVLVLRTGEYKAKPERSHTPDLPGGIVEAGESEMEGALREVEEETGIVVPLKLAFLGFAQTESYEQENKSVTKLLYVARISERPEVQLSFEHEAYEWAPAGELLSRYEFRPFYRKAIEYIIAAKLL